MKLSIGLMKKIFTLSVISSPILKQYSSPIPGVSLADLTFLMIIAFILIIDRKIVISSKVRTLLIFWFITTCISGVSFLLHQNFDVISVIRYAKYTFYLFIVILSIKYFDFRLGIDFLIKISTLIGIYILIQYLSYNFFSTILPFKILPFSWASGSEFSIKDVEYIAYRYFYRPSGIFIEPAAAAQFLLPGLVFAIYNKNDRNTVRYMIVAILVASIYLTTSTQGLAVLIFIILLKLYSLHTKYYLKVFVYGITVISLLIIISRVNLFELINSFILSFESVERGSSLAIRIFRGFEVFKFLPIIYMLIGVGHGNLGNYVLSNQIITKYDPIPLTEAFAEYANAFSLVLLYYGLIGSVLFLVILIDVGVHTKNAHRLLLYVYCLLMLSSGVFFNISIVFYFALLYSGYGRE